MLRVGYHYIGLCDRLKHSGSRHLPLLLTNPLFNLRRTFGVLALVFDLPQGHLHLLIMLVDLIRGIDQSNDDQRARSH